MKTTNERLQLELERKYAQQNTIHTLKKALGEQSFIDDAVFALSAYLNKNHDYAYVVDGETRIREDLKEAHRTLMQLDTNKLFMSLFCHIWSKNQHPVTIQELVGMCVKQLDDMSSMYRKLVAVELILATFSTIPLVEVNTTFGETVFFKCKIPLTEELEDAVNDKGYVLPSIVKPKEVKHNKQIGYQTFSDSLILGGKYHEEYQNYNHINRVNGVAFEYEHRLELLTKPVFSMEPKVRKDGQWETKEDIIARYKAFQHVHSSLEEKVNIIKRYTDKFYLVHAYDTRGRTYVKAYEFNYQGSSYLKAMVNLHNKEVIKEEF